MKKIKNIITPSTPLSKKCDYKIDTELLFGEDIELIDEKNNFILCKSLIDNYIGWIKKKDVGVLPKPSHKVTQIRTFVFEDADMKSKIISYLPFGSKIKSFKVNNDWSKFNLTSKSFAYIPSINIKKISNLENDWVDISKKFINTPYKWGGRDSFGIDCSSLVQLSLQSAGIYIPRDTVDQKLIKWKNITDLSNLQRGMLIFWKSHVGIMLNEHKLIHANATSMNVIVEDLSVVIKRHQKNKIGDIEIILNNTNLSQQKFLLT